MPYLHISLYSYRRRFYTKPNKLPIFFETPREMTIDEIKRIVSRFALTAELASDAGSAVVEIQRRPRILSHPIPAGEDE